MSAELVESADTEAGSVTSSDESQSIDGIGRKDLEERFHCCCGVFHVTTGTYIITLVSFFFIISNFVMKLAGYSETAWDWELLFLVVDTIALVSLFYGVFAQRPAFIQPFVVLSIITTSFLVLLAASMACAAYDPSSYSGQDLEIELHKRLSDAAHQLSLQFQSMISIVASVCFVFVLSSAIAHCWFVVLAVRCAQYFRELHKLDDRSEICVESDSDTPSQVTVQ